MSQPRVSFIAWFTCLNRLPTKSRLFRWGVVDNNVCVFCQNSEETRDHLFGACPVVLPILKKIFHAVGIYHAPCSFDDYIQLFHMSTKRTDALFSLRAAVFCVVIDKIWSLRNAMVFRQEPVVVDMACKQLSQSLILRFVHSKYGSNRHFRKAISRLQQL